MTQRNTPKITRQARAKIIAVGSPANRIAELIGSSEHQAIPQLVVEPGSSESAVSFLTDNRLSQSTSSDPSTSWLDDWYFGYESSVRDFAADAAVVYLICGMGRDTGARIAPLISDTVRAANVACVALPIMPFGFEGRFRRHAAEIALSELKRSASVTLDVSSDESTADRVTTVLDVMTGIANDVETSITELERLFDRTGALSQISTGWSKISSASDVVTGSGVSLHAGRDAVVRAISTSAVAEADSATLLVRGGIAMSFGQVAETLSTLHEWVTIHGDVGITVEHDQSLGSKIEITVLLNKHEDALVAAPSLGNFDSGRTTTAVEDLFGVADRELVSTPELQPAI